MFESYGCAIVLSSVCSTGNNNNAVVTASYALFAEDNTVPYAVLGYQFQHQKLFNEFKNITSKVKL
jgi:hypothetical protein